jgi:hypothetical protein
MLTVLALRTVQLSVEELPVAMAAGYAVKMAIDGVAVEGGSSTTKLPV